MSRVYCKMPREEIIFQQHALKFVRNLNFTIVRASTMFLIDTNAFEFQIFSFENYIWNEASFDFY